MNRNTKKEAASLPFGKLKARHEALERRAESLNQEVAAIEKQRWVGEEDQRRVAVLKKERVWTQDRLLSIAPKMNVK